MRHGAHHGGKDYRWHRIKGTSHAVLDAALAAEGLRCRSEIRRRGRWGRALRRRWERDKASSGRSGMMRGMMGLLDAADERVVVRG